MTPLCDAHEEFHGFVERTNDKVDMAFQKIDAMAEDVKTLVSRSAFMDGAESAKKESKGNGFQLGNTIIAAAAVIIAIIALFLKG